MILNTYICPMDIKRPPLGIMPYYLWKEYFPTPTQEDINKRVIELENTIKRYEESDFEPLHEWFYELNEHI